MTVLKARTNTPSLPGYVTAMPEAKLVLLFVIVAMTVVFGTVAAATYVAQPAGTGSQTSNTTTSSSTVYCGPFGCDESSTTTSASSTQSGSAGGLLLRLELNSSRIASGATVGINLSDYNPSHLNLNLSKQTAWVLGGLSTGGCPSLYYPFGIAVFQGRYDSANVSQAVPLRIFPVVACPMLVRYITGYLFQPMSDNATVLPGTGEAPMATGVSVSGTYSTAGNQWNQLMPFTPGTYTVVGGDEWGNLAFAYFAAVALS